MTSRFLVLGFLTLSIGAFFIFGGKTIDINQKELENSAVESEIKKEERSDGDIENQKSLTSVPENIKALYATSYVAGTPSIMNKIIKTAEETEINAIVIDLKDYSGYLGYNTDLEKPKEYLAVELRIKYLNKLIKELHDKNIYLIARVSVFQDPRLAKARPDLAVKTKDGKIWEDKKGLTWVDPNSKEVWDYNVAIAEEAFNRGFDEVNFDYIRFPSDGNGVSGLTYPFWNKNEEEKRVVIKNFFKFLKEKFPERPISGDVFGQTTVDKEDLGIGQVLEDAYNYFDYVAPMIYPSHFENGFIGYKNPAEYPEEVIEYSLKEAVKRIEEYELLKQREVRNSTTTPEFLLDEEKKAVRKKIRPWLQDFDLGAIYTPEMIRKEIKGVKEAGLSDSWMIWNPKNIYREDIFIKE
ncbi:MAG: putative glycoside hydrolase [Candidatus Pacebacteria bacterium]|nr:putative glycoside hydrolase [Candidatus Paceibacterota bacterium]